MTVLRACNSRLVMHLRTKMGVSSLMLGLMLPGLGACGEEGKDGQGPDKAAYETAASVLKGPVAMMSAFKPHLDIPKLEGEYTPKDNRNDLSAASYYAANAIRHVANDARQKATRSESAVAKELAAPITEVAKACATPDDEQDVDKCKATLEALDEALADASTKAEAAGAAALPRLGDAAIDDEAKAEVALFVAAKGPNPAEKALLDAMKDESKTPKDLLSGCEKTMGELDGVIMKLERKPEELKEVAIVHKEKVKSWCVRMKDMATILDALEGPCADNADTDECKQMCAKGRRRLSQGTVAAAFEKLKKVRKEVCVDEEK